MCQSNHLNNSLYQHTHQPHVKREHAPQYVARQDKWIELEQFEATARIGEQYDIDHDIDCAVCGARVKLLGYCTVVGVQPLTLKMRALHMCRNCHTRFYTVSLVPLDEIEAPDVVMIQDARREQIEAPVLTPLVLRKREQIDYQLIG